MHNLLCLFRMRQREKEKNKNEHHHHHSPVHAAERGGARERERDEFDTSYSVQTTWENECETKESGRRK